MLRGMRMRARGPFGLRRGMRRLGFVFAARLGEGLGPAVSPVKAARQRRKPERKTQKSGDAPSRESNMGPHSGYLATLQASRLMCWPFDTR